MISPPLVLLGPGSHTHRSLAAGLSDGNHKYAFDSPEQATCLHCKNMTSMIPHPSFFLVLSSRRPKQTCSFISTQNYWSAQHTSPPPTMICSRSARVGVAAAPAAGREGNDKTQSSSRHIFFPFYFRLFAGFLRRYMTHIAKPRTLNCTPPHPRHLPLDPQPTHSHKLIFRS